jgi:hypothetical protein
LLEVLPSGTKVLFIFGGLRAAGCFTPELAARLAALVDVTDRDNDPQVT